jgi:hypothetical protein
MYGGICIVETKIWAFITSQAYSIKHQLQIPEMTTAILTIWKENYMQE